MLKEGDYVRFVPSNIDELIRDKVTGWENITGIIDSRNALFTIVKWDKHYKCLDDADYTFACGNFLDRLHKIDDRETEKIEQEVVDENSDRL